MSELVASIPHRLSVIIPTRNARAGTERAVNSVLSQVDPIGTEVIVADDGSRDGTPEHIEEIFGGEIASGRLRVERFDLSGDPGMTRNRGAGRATGSLLAFLNPTDYWRPGRLEWLEPLLKKTDLLLTTREPVADASDWVRVMVDSNLTVTSGAVIRRSLFDEVGGFPEGYSGPLLPRRIPGSEDYEFWLRCLIHLVKTDQRERVRFEDERFVVAAEKQPLPPPVEAMAEKLRGARELVSLIAVAPKIPPRYWMAVAKRVGASGKSLFKKK